MQGSLWNIRTIDIEEERKKMQLIHLIMSEDFLVCCLLSQKCKMSQSSENRCHFPSSKHQVPLT